jgi:beta-lactamase regulating signal transducer with metallopeptidase domain
MAYLALDGVVILGLGSLAALWCRQPVRRLRIIEIAIIGALVVPCVAHLPGMPGISLGVLEAKSPASDTTSRAETVLPQDLASPALEPPGSKLVAESGSASLTYAVPHQGGPVSEAGVADSPFSAAVQKPVSASWPPSRWLALFYLAGATLVATWWLVGIVQLANLLMTATHVPPAIVSEFVRIAGPAGRRVRILSSPRVPLAITFTLWRPFIVLPELLVAGDGEPHKYCLAHEWSHIEGRDSERWHLTNLAQICFFFVPYYWWLRSQVRLCQDYLADARAALQARETTDYAQYLVDIARNHIAPNAAALGIGDRRSNLSRRIHMLLNQRQPLERRTPLRWSLAVLLVGFCLLGATAAVRLDAREPVDDKKVNAAKESSQKAEAPKVEALHYSGKVFDKDTKKGIAGATVTVRRSLYGDPERKEPNFIVEESKHKTDAEGKYQFVIPSDQVAERYLYIELDVEAPGYAPRKHFGYALSMILKNEKLGGRPFFESVDLRPAQEITGMLRTPDDKPAPGVKVMAYSNTDKKSEEFEYGSFADTRTDADGRYRLWIITPGPAYVWFLPTQFVPETHILKNNKRGDMGAFTLHDGPRICGKVLDAQGKPIAGINVNAESQDRNEEITLPVADQINRSAVTDAKGNFAMSPLPPGTYRLKPDEHARDASLDKRTNTKFDAVFAPKKLVLKADIQPEPIEVRASPHVVIEAQCYDSAGKPTRSHEFHVFGQIDGGYWFGQSSADASGRLVARVPHGLEKVQLNLMTNEHGALRWRRGNSGEYQNQRRIDLGTVNEDITNIQIVRYKAPIVIVKLKAPDGVTLDKPGVTAVYTKGKRQNDGQFILANGRNSDINFEHQEDGRFRSEQMFPDDEAQFIGHADGYASKPVTFKLAEGATKEIEITLEKADKK